MKIYMECIPCMLNQTVNVCKEIGIQEEDRKTIMKNALKVLAGFENYESSPGIIGDVIGNISEFTDLADPYSTIKEKDLEAALKLYPYCREEVMKAEDQLKASLQFAAIGNSLDAAVAINPDIEAMIEDEVAKGFEKSDYAILAEKLRMAETILYIGDNVGESVFDTLALEQLSEYGKCYYATRDCNIINDVTVAYAYKSGIDRFATILSSGSAYPGTIINECSEKFLDLYRRADVIIAKGQGNFETLDNEHNIFFLLKAKCALVASHIGSQVQTYNLIYKK